MSCSKSRPDFSDASKEFSNVIKWSIEPDNAKLKREKTFLIHGKELYSAEIVVDKSVEILEREVFENGTKLKIKIKVTKLDDDTNEVVGYRNIVLVTVNFYKRFRIYINNEK